MANLCPRCGAHERVLETIGVFRCPACGRVNADGEPIPDGATEVAKFAVRSGEASFAAPPPVAPPVSGSRAAIPRLALVFIVSEAILTLVDAAMAGTDSVVRVTFRVGILGGLVLGDRDVYRVACLSWLVVLVYDVYRLTSWWSFVALSGHVMLVLLLLLDAAFLAALFSPDVRRHYERAAAK